MAGGSIPSQATINIVTGVMSFGGVKVIKVNLDKIIEFQVKLEGLN